MDNDGGIRQQATRSRMRARLRPRDSRDPSLNPQNRVSISRGNPVNQLGRSLALGAVALAMLAMTPVSAVSAEASAAVATPSQTPSQVVTELHDVLLGVMRDAVTLGYEGRFNALKPVLPELFDIHFMAEKSVGRHWKKASDADQAKLLDTFTQFTIANYAGRFDGYSGQTFEIIKEVPSLRDTILVHSRLNDPTGDEVQLNYRLRIVGSEWKIIDVYLNGTVSELALRRSEYSSLIKREGLEALITALNERIGVLGHSEMTADQSS
jgi:phospholipid transport system substrate-binding protein